MIEIGEENMDKRIEAILKEEIRSDPNKFCNLSITFDPVSITISELPKNQKKCIVSLSHTNNSMNFPFTLDKYWEIKLPDGEHHQYGLKYNPYSNEILVSEIINNQDNNI
jgi:hypothetical protein